MNISVDYQVDADGEVPAAAAIEAWVSAAAHGAGVVHDIEVSVRVVEHDEGRSLNAHWRGRDYATNVLSFPAGLPAELGLALLGDIVICAPVVAEEARAQDKPPDAHWAHMVVHGTLHLLGYDHSEEDDAHEMEALETRILTGMNYPPPYEDSTAPAAGYRP